MAKNLTPAEIIASLESMGLPVPAELVQRAENEKADLAEIYIGERLNIADEKKRVAESEVWRERFFSLADDFVTMFNGQEKNVGQGRVFERFVSFELPDGSNLTVRHREPREKK